MSIHSDLSIADLFKGDLHLASSPNIYFELQKTIEDPNKSLTDTAYFIEKDAALSLRLMKIVNSAFYGFPSKIVSIDRAINLIGAKELQNIVLSTFVIDKFSDLPCDLISMHDFWAQNLRTALIAQEIDSFLGKEFAESVFICGIMHHIGQLVIFRRLPELAREVSLMLQSQELNTDAEETRLEENIIGFNHFEVGSELTRIWKLPSIITDSIRLHPQPENTEANQKIASIIRVANEYSKIDIDVNDFQINNLGLSKNDMAGIINNAYDDFEEILKVFYPE